MTKKNLHNILNKEELKVALNKESFYRITASFYRYVKIEEPDYFRDFIYEQFNDMNNEWNFLGFIQYFRIKDNYSQKSY